jgi:hypothetical protein
MNAKLHPDLERLLQLRFSAEQELHRNRVQLRYYLCTALLIPLLFVGLRSLEMSFLAKCGVLLLFVLVALLIRELWISFYKPDLKRTARAVEAEQPELQGALLTAVEREHDAKVTPSYLDWLLMEKVVSHAGGHDWIGAKLHRELKQVSWQKTALQWFQLAMILLTALWLPWQAKSKTRVAAPELSTAVSVESVQVAVTPGDAEVERGGRLIVEARFTGAVPAEAVIVLQNMDGTERSRFPLNRTVEASLFGGVITDLQSDALYHIEFAGGKSKTSKLTTFDYPALVKLDATVTPPAWMDLPPTEVKNSMNFSVPEGSRVDFRVTVNKPLSVAELYGEDKTSVPIRALPSEPLMLLGSFDPVKSQKYRVHLVDEKERSSKQTPVVTIRVLPNLTPKIEVNFPKRDLAVSPLQELPVEGKVWDDAGVQRAGATFMLAGDSREVVLSDVPSKGGKPRDLKTLFNLEPLQARPKQLVSYYLWAEDKGADGKSRRSMSDMFFAEVRHFEDIFREAEAPPGPPGAKSDTDELAKLQKQVVNANWRLVRDTAGGKKLEAIAHDVDVVRESEQIAHEKTLAAVEKSEDPELKQALQEAAKAMEKTFQQLAVVNEKRETAGLDTSLGSAREALEFLHQANSREHQVTRNNSKSESPQGQSAEKQLMELELKQEERRYEEESEPADEAATAEQQENLQVLNRLKELAARQEALAEKMKQLEQQRQEAGTEEKKQEVERQLKRLQEEQEQLLQDLDELKERMEQPENMANMSEAREQLQQARAESQKAAEELGKEQTAQAAADATRAQRELEEIRDEFRERTAKRFAQEMRQLKQQAQDLEAGQEKLAETLEQAASSKDETAKDAAAGLEQALANNKLAREMENQQEALEKVLEEARKLSEAAEPAEPLLSTSLHDAVRKAQSSGTEEAMEIARDLLRAGDTSRAQEQQQRSGKGISELKAGITKAAESVLGSEAESLRMARVELDKALKQISPEASDNASEGKAGEAKGGEGKPAPSPTGQGSEGKAGEVAEQGEKPGQGGKPGEASQDPGMAPGKTLGQGQQGQQGQGQMAGNSGANERGNKPGGTKPSPTGNGGSGNANSGGANSGDDWFFDAPVATGETSPLTGEGYDRLSDSLRRVEELLETPELRDQAARVREEARDLRLEQKRNNAPPQAQTIATRLGEPLAELRDRVSEELARRESANPLAPLDRDPVPPRYREQTRRYYTELGGVK